MRGWSKLRTYQRRLINCGILNGKIIDYRVEEFKEAVLGKYFSRERRGVKVEEFINIY